MGNCSQRERRKEIEREREAEEEVCGDRGPQISSLPRHTYCSIAGQIHFPINKMISRERKS